MPNPLQPNEHILTNINEINSFSNWELVCYIAGISPDTAITYQSLRDVMNRIAIFQQGRGQAQPVLVSNNSYIQQLDGLGATPEDTLVIYATNLRSYINAADEGFSIHRIQDVNTLSSDSPENNINEDQISQMPTLFLDPSVTNGDMTEEKLNQFNSTAMRNYVNQSLRDSDIRPEALADMLVGLRSAFSGEEPSAQNTPQPENTAAEGPTSASTENTAAEGPKSESTENTAAESPASESTENTAAESEPSVASGSDTEIKTEPVVTEEEPVVTEEEPVITEEEPVKPKKKPRQRVIMPDFDEDYKRFKENEAKSESKTFERYVDSEDEDLTDEEIAEINKPEIKEPVKEEPDISEEEAELYTKIIKLVAATNKLAENSESAPAGNPQSNEAEEEEEMIIDNSEESLLSRWLDHGIDMKTYDSVKGIALLSQLTGTELNGENRTYENVTKALDKIVVNGKSAKEFFNFQDPNSTLDGVHPIKDNDTYMEYLTNKLIGDFSNAIDSVVKGTDIKGDHAQRAFILIKDENGVARPLKLDAEDVAHTEMDEYTDHPMAPKDRLVSYQEARDYVLNEAKQKMLQRQNSNGYTYGIRVGEDIPERIHGAEYTSALNRISPNQRSRVEDAALHMPEIANTDLIALYETEYIPLVQEIKKTDEYKKMFNDIKASIEEENKGRPRSSSELSPSEAAEKQAVQKYLLSLKDAQKGVLMSEVAIEFERRAADRGSIEAEVNKILESNLKNYNKYQAEKLSMEGGELHESLKEQAEEYNKLMDVYAKKVNNGSLSNEEEHLLERYAQDKIPNVKFSLDDLTNSESLLKAMREKNIDINDISINGQGLKPLMRETLLSTQANRNNADIENRINSMTEQDVKIMMRSKTFRDKLCECFDKMIHPDSYGDMQTMPVITIKTPAGEMVPEITQGKELTVLPKVEEFPDWRKRISRQSTIDANLREVKAFEDSFLDKLQRDMDNAGLADINSAIRINAKYAMGKPLTPEEMSVASELRTNVPNQAVQTRSLNNLQQSSANHQPNTQELTAPVNESTLENNKGMNKK